MRLLTTIFFLLFAVLALAGMAHAQYVPIPNEQSGNQCPNSIDQCSGFKIRADINKKFSALGASDCQWTANGSFQCTKINGAAIATGFATGLNALNAIPIVQVQPSDGQCLKYSASLNSFVFGTCGGGGGGGGAGGASTQAQFNNQGTLAGTPKLTINPSTGNVSSITAIGPTSITGNQTSGADQISHVNVNGYFNPVTYGADPTGVNNSCAAIQAAIDGACAATIATFTTPVIDIPAGVYKCEQPIWDHCASNGEIKIKGAGEFATQIKSTFTGNILVASSDNVYSSGGGTLVSSLASGSGNAFQLGGSSTGYIDLNSVLAANITTSPYSGPFNGLSAFDVRGYFKIGTVATHLEYIWASDGPMNGQCNAIGSCTQGLWVSTDGVLHGQLNVNGTLVKLNSGATTVTGGNCYETELSYDGAHVNLYLGGNGTSSCASSPGTVTRVAQTAASGNVTQTLDEQNVLFADWNGFYQNGYNFAGPDVDITTDSIQISKVARNTAASYTQDTAKFGTDSNTLFLWNYDQTPTFASNSPIAKITTPANGFVTWINSATGCCGGLHEIDDLQVEGGGAAGTGIFGDTAQLGLNRVFAGNVVGATNLTDGIFTIPNATFNSYANDVDSGTNPRYGMGITGGLTKVHGYGQLFTSSGFVPFMMSSGIYQEIYTAPNAHTRCSVVMETGDGTLERADEDAENGGNATGVCIIPDQSSRPYTIRNSELAGVNVPAIQIENNVGNVGDLLIQANQIDSQNKQVLDTSLVTAAIFHGPVNLVSNACHQSGATNTSCLDNGYSIIGSGPAIPYCLTEGAGQSCFAPFANLPACSASSLNDKVTVEDALGPCINGQAAFGGGSTSCDVYCDGSSTWRYRGSLGQFTNISVTQGVVTPYAVSFVDGHITFANSTTCTAATGNVTCNVPSGTVDNDGLIMCIAAWHPADPWVAPGGWGSAIKSSISGSNTLITCFPRVSAGSEAGTPYTFTSGSGGTNLSRASAIMIDYKGTNTSTLVETSGNARGQSQVSPTTATAPTITTSTADDLLLTTFATCGQLTTLPLGQTIRINTLQTVAPNPQLQGLYVADETILLAGATGTRSAGAVFGPCDDFSGAVPNVDWGAANIALKPNASAGSTHNIDWSLANNQFRTIADNITYTFSNVPTSTTQPQYLNVRTCEDSTGGRTVAFPGTVKWPGGTQPSMTTTANYCTIWQFEADNSNVYGSQVADAVH